MSHHASSWAIERSPKFVEHIEQDGQRTAVVLDDKPDPYGKFILMILADFAGPEGVTWRGSREVAAKALIRHETVRRILGRLEDQRLLCRVPRLRADGSQTSSVIVLAPFGDRGSMTDPTRHSRFGNDIAKHFEKLAEQARNPRDLNAQGGDLNDQGCDLTSRRTEPVNEMDDDSAREEREELVADDVWAQVAERLRRVPEWANALDLGAELPCYSIVQEAPDAPWVSIAARQSSSRLDPASGSIKTNSPRMALEFGLTDWRDGRLGGRSTATSDRPAWDEAWTRLRQVFFAGNQHPLDLLAALSVDDADLAIASLVADAGATDWHRFAIAVRQDQDTFEGRQATAALRRMWRGVTPDRQVVEDAMDQADRAVWERCQRDDVTRDQLAVHTPPRRDWSDA